MSKANKMRAAAQSATALSVKAIDREIGDAIPPTLPPAARANVVAALRAHIEKRLNEEQASVVESLTQAVCYTLSASAAHQAAGRRWLDANPAEAKRERYVFDRHAGMAELKRLMDGAPEAQAPQPYSAAPKAGPTIPQAALQLIFAQVGIHGDFPPPLVEIVRRHCAPRTVIYLAFPPKCGGTFLREAVGRLAGAGLYRPAHALGGRDVVPYLPSLAALLMSPSGPERIMTHAHLMGHYANIAMLNLFSIKPVIMKRSIPDMLCSFFDMAESEGRDAEGRYNWSLLCGVHTDSTYLSMSAEARRDFLVYHQAPWYFQFYASWLRATREGRIPALWIDYEGLRAGPAQVVSAILDYYEIPHTAAEVESVLAATMAKRARLRFNKGTSGRGAGFLTAHHRAHLARLAAGYPDIDFAALGLLPAASE